MMGKLPRPDQKGKKRVTLSDERNIAVYYHYKRVIAKHGIMAHRMKKRELYEETARPFFIQPKRVERIISSIYKSSYRHIPDCVKQEIDEAITNVEQAVSDADKDRNKTPGKGKRKKA